MCHSCFLNSLRIFGICLTNWCINTTLEHAVGSILEVEAAYNTFKKESELKSLRIAKKSVFGSSDLCLATVTVPSNLLQRLSDVPTVSLPSTSYCNFRAYLQNRYMRYNMYSGRPCENSLQNEAPPKGENIYTKILQKLWLVYGIYVFKNSVLVFMMFICKLANQRRQILPIHRFYSHTGTQVSKKYCCAPLFHVNPIRCLIQR